MLHVSSVYHVEASYDDRMLYWWCLYVFTLMYTARICKPVDVVPGCFLSVFNYVDTVTAVVLCSGGTILLYVGTPTPI